MLVLPLYDLFRFSSFNGIQRLIERLLSERANSSKFLRLPIPVGIGPESKLWDKPRLVNDVRFPISGGIVPVRWLEKRWRICRLLRFHSVVGIWPERLLSERSNSSKFLRLPIPLSTKKVRLEQSPSSEGIEEVNSFTLKSSFSSFLNCPMERGIAPSKKLPATFKNLRWDRLPIEDGIRPLRLLSLTLKCVRFGNEAKSSASSVPLRFEPGRLISEIDPPLLQAMAVQLQRWVMLVRDHELRKGGGEGGEREFFHLTRACASVVGDDEA
ncbi:hypothetical protein BT93_B0276 [Corymbia citriodora subsp. variegata]|nr:hypothetical protein BT93_B0276 [Corymbia citriodora subsp. variegata]